MAVTPDSPAPAVNVPGEGTLRATIVTTMGDIDVELYENEAPRTVANFVALATGAVEWSNRGQKTKEPLYKDLTIHRVIPEFMIQLGCPLGNGTGGPGYRFGDEIHPKLKHDKPGMLSMANAGPGTNGSQFFVTEVPTPWLDGKHAVFGTVTKGLDIAKQIARVPVGPGDKPKTPVILKEIKIYRA